MTTLDLNNNSKLNELKLEDNNFSLGDNIVKVLRMANITSPLKLPEKYTVLYSIPDNKIETINNDGVIFAKMLDRTDVTMTIKNILLNKVEVVDYSVKGIIAVDIL